MTANFLTELGRNIDESFFLIGFAMLLIEIANGLFKNRLKWRGVADMLVNVSTQVPFFLVQITVIYAMYQLFQWVSASWISWTFEINAWTIVLAILVADLLYYWEHRFAHVVRLLWIHHAVHHSSRYMNITTGVRFGPFEGVWSMVAVLPMVIAGFPAELVVFGTLVVLAYQTWLHTELIGKLGPVEWLFNTPSHHRVHHGCDPEYLDKNYGGILIVWDRLFGTFQEELRTPRYGLARDFDSVNPFVVWFSELPKFFRELFQAKSLHELFNRLFNRPEWQPARSSLQKPLATEPTPGGGHPNGAARNG